jgi:polyhydroxyalkanoate synthesis regulator phasin
MKEFLKRGLYLGVGAFTLTKEKIEQVVDDLVHRGEADQKDRRDLIEEFMKRAQEFEKELTEKIKNIVINYGFASKKEVEELKKRIEGLEKKLAEKKATPGTPGKTKSTKTTKTTKSSSKAAASKSSDKQSQ